MNEKLETQGEATATEGTVSASDVRNHELFKSVVGPLSKERDELKARLDALEKSQQEAAAAREMKEKEARGEYDSIVSNLQAEIKRKEQEFSAEMQRRDLQAELMKQGANNDFFIKGAIANYDGGDMAEYVAGLAKDESNAAFFARSDASHAQPAPNGAVPASRAPSNWTTIKADLKSGDSAKAKAAGKLIQDYVMEHGQMPPG